jgi:hypothetical protein
MGFSLKSVFKAAVTAAVIAAIVAVTIGTGGATFSVFVTTAATYAAIANSVMQLTAKTPDQYDLSSQLRGQLISQRNPAADARVIYGKVRTGGTIVHMETIGSKNETMHMAIVIAGHETNALNSLYVNDEKLSLSVVSTEQRTGTRSVSDGEGGYYDEQYTYTVTLDNPYYSVNYKGSTSVINVDYLFGTDTQSPMADLFAGSSAQGYAFKGLSVLGAKLVFNQDKFPQGLPNITAEVEGKKVYDPRTSTTAYSSNPALCIRDYLTNTSYGLGATGVEVDDDSFIAAADICDEDVDLAVGGTEKRYTLNGTFLTSEKPKDVLSKMLMSCGGNLTYVGGKWTIKVAEYRTPSMTLTDDDFVSEITIQGSVSRRDLFNAVKGTYSEPDALYQISSFPPVTNSTYSAQDNETIWKDIQFPFTTSVATCQRLAKIDLEKMRQQITVTVSCNMKAFALQTGDTVYLDIDRYGWSNKVFEVADWNFDFTDTENGAAPVVSMTLRETASGIYDWNSGNETVIDIAPNTNLPDPFTVNAPAVAITDVLEIAAETVITKLVVTISGETNFQDNYEVQAKISTADEWINLGKASGNVFELYNVIDGAFYNVRARAINTLNVRSEWSTGIHEVIGKTAPPEDVTGFSINIVGTQAYLTWNPVGDLDLSHYRIRHARETTGATYSNSIDIVTKVPRPSVFAVCPAMTGTYFIKAIDKLGNESLNSAEIVTIIEDIKGLNVIETVTEHTAFAGTKVECNVTDEGYLVLDTASDFDSITGDFDDAEGDFDGGGGTTSLEGTYYFGQVVDLGSVYTSRVTANIKVGRVDYVNLFDDQSGDFDSKAGLFDGDPNTYGDTNVEFFIATTEDDPNGTPTWTDYRRFYVGDYKARGLKFKIVMTTVSTSASPSVSELSVSVDMPDRVTAGNDLVSGAGAYAVTFSPAFKATPAIGIAAQNLAQGDYYEITSKSATGFTITFKNSGGSAVNRTFDYVAKGYGELAA